MINPKRQQRNKIYAARKKFCPKFQPWKKIYGIQRQASSWN
jgi:hypothetical protein